MICGRSVVFSRYSTNKTDRHNITEILLKVAFNTTTLSLYKTTLSAMKKLPSLSRDNLLVFYYLSLYGNPMRRVAFGGRGLINGRLQVKGDSRYGLKKMSRTGPPMTIHNKFLHVFFYLAFYQHKDLNNQLNWILLNVELQELMYCCRCLVLPCCS